MVKNTSSATSAVKKAAAAAPSLRMMNALPDPVIAFDSMLKVCLSNISAQKFFKIGKTQLLEKYMVELLGSKSAVLESVNEAVRKGVTITLHDVSIREQPVSSVIISTAEPGSLYLMIIRREAGVQLSNKRDKPSARSLKKEQPPLPELEKSLTEIEKAVRILVRSQLSVKDRQLVGRIATEASKMRGLLDKFNIFYAVQPDRHRAVNLHEVLNRAACIAQEAYGDKIEIREYFDPELPDIRGNFDQLVQAKLNLIKNAAEAFANRKGQISIRTFYDAAAAGAAAENGAGQLRIEIEDNGKGIKPEVIDHIFHPYFTTKKNAPGLGLPITSKIVYDHGGTIKVASEPGKTVFKINLPLPVSGRPVRK